MNGGTIVINFQSKTITSTSVTTMAVVTDTVKHKSYIECYFQTSSGQVGLHLLSRDQRRIEAFFQQLTTAVAGGHAFQITAYASSTYQTDGYVANLESDLVYSILH